MNAYIATVTKQYPPTRAFHRYLPITILQFKLVNCNTITYRHNEYARDRNCPLTIQLQSSTGVKQLKKMFLKIKKFTHTQHKELSQKTQKNIQKTQNSQTKSQKSQKNNYNPKNHEKNHKSH